MKKIIIMIALLCLNTVNGNELRQLVEINTNMGPIIIELYSKKAPKTVQNFLAYVDKGFYDETIFHRVIDGFMIQGGGFTTDMEKKKPMPPLLMNQIMD